ncbi:salicylate hydroxylase, partial [Lecanoromycetidae sp. Uapishka_2]
MTATTPQKPFNIAICGGGIAGLALAIGLLHRNVPFHLYESAHAFAEVGAGVSFGPNSIRAMDLIDPKIRKGYERRATHNASPDKKDIWFDFYAGMNCGLGKAGDYICAVRDGQKEHPVQSSIHRAAFLDELVALMPKENVTFGKRVIEVQETSHGVRLHFEDGGSAEASAAIGCDGVKSKIRQFVLGDEDPAVHPSFTKKYAYRGLIPMSKAVSLLGDELARNAVMYCGLHGHILTFPIEKGETMNVVAFRTKRDGKWEDERWVLPMDREGMESDYEDWGESVKKILSLMEKPDVWALFDYPPAKTYYKGRICLSGDGAHASTPHQGAGAGMALEDAFVMSSLLGEVDTAEGIEQAFEAFDAVRRPRTQKLVTTSREAGELYDCEEEGVGDDREAMRRNLGERYKWIWEKNSEEDLDMAMGMLKGVRGKARLA